MGEVMPNDAGCRSVLVRVGFDVSICERSGRGQFGISRRALTFVVV